MTFAGRPTYDSYKDSGVEWIGAVPADWRVEPGRQCLYESKDKNIGMKESTVLSLSYGRVIVKDEDKLTGLVPESFETYQIVKPGDIIIRGTDLQNDMTSLRTGLARDTGIITSAYINLRPKAQIEPVFLHYLLHSYDVKKVFYALGSGLRQNLSYDDFKYLRLPIPSPGEQRAIAAFLDEKCAKVDDAVRIKEEQICLLRERRQVLIQQAVTCGLNPDAPMKDSGIDWIGQIPAHWDVAKLKFLSTKIVDGTHFTPTYVDEGVPFLRVTDLSSMRNGVINWEGVRRIPSKEHIELSRRADGKRGDVLLSKNGTIGITRVVDWDEAFSFFVSLCLIKLTKELSPYYFVSFFSSPLVDEQISFGSLRTSVTNLHLEKIKELLIVVPPRSEQENIVAHIKSLSKPVDEAIAIKEDQISALKEYKTSLIHAAVTGKIKVA